MYKLCVVYVLFFNLQAYDNAIDAGSDVQKKITPWNNSREIQMELFPEIPLPVDDKPRQGLILVASLLQKPPNLGGIACHCINSSCSCVL